MKELAVKNAEAIGAGHSFLIFLKNAFPVSVLNAVKACPEVCRVFCATANPVEVVVAVSGAGRRILGVIDGGSPRGVEDEAAVEARRALLRQIGYKR
jgi:adenosine/AMP kinase